MKIYFLRHEKRPNEQYFDISLTEEGVKDSYKLKDTLKELHIHEIYSSPFIRVLETVQPFIIENNLQINIEYSLYEFVTHNWFNENNYNKILTNDQEKKYMINKDYDSLFNIQCLEFPQDDKKIKKIVDAFITHIIQKYKNTDVNILLVSHKKVFDVIVNKEKTDYPMGGLSLIYETELLNYKPLNF
tara:strand:+ start:83 stop:643 length:561 start_codon:yes stop_codon:yes gene_type:complete